MADNDDRRLLASSREPGRTSDLYADMNAPEVYADGLGAIGLGPAVSRIGFFKIYDVTPSDTDGLDEMVEKRRINLNLIMPTTSLIDFAANVVAAAVSNRETFSAPNKLLLEGLDRSLEVIRKALKDQ